MNSREIDTVLDRMAAELGEHIRSEDTQGPLLIGIHTGGYWVAEALQRRLRPQPELGELNIAFYRDDFSRIGMHPRVSPSKLPFSIEDRVIILVDDVLHTGRTIRAAMNEIFDYGRPARILLAVLVDRPGHELPIRADVTGVTLNLETGQHVKLSGPDPLALEIRNQDA